MLFCRGPGKISISPLRPPAPPVTPLKRSLREGVRHCTPSLYCTQRLHRETGELSVSDSEQTEGE